MGTAAAGPPPGWIHVDAKAGRVFGNAPHHWFKPSRDRQSDADDAQPAAVELAVTTTMKTNWPWARSPCPE